MYLMWCLVVVKMIVECVVGFFLKLSLLLLCLCFFWELFGLVLFFGVFFGVFIGILIILWRICNRVFFFLLFLIEKKVFFILGDILVLVFNFIKFGFCKLVLVNLIKEDGRVVENSRVCFDDGSVWRILVSCLVKFILNRWLVLLKIMYLIEERLRFILIFKCRKWLGVVMMILGFVVIWVNCFFRLLLLMRRIVFRFVLWFSFFIIFNVCSVSLWDGERIKVLVLILGLCFFKCLIMGMMKVVVFFEFVCVIFIIFFFFRIRGIVFFWIGVGIEKFFFVMVCNKFVLRFLRIIC